MEKHTADSPVTLIIRAPNQRYDDQPISCFLDWTVEKVKKHITTVYPSRPLSREQRLVYSGRLLQDDQQLWDVLQKRDACHMVYLLCSPRNLTSDPSDPSVTSDPTPMNVPDRSYTGSTDVSRRRVGGAHTRLRPEGAVFPAAFPPHSVYSRVQVMWWQCVYVQQYYLHYQAAVAAAQAPPLLVNPGQSVTPAPATVPVNPAPLEQPANPNPQMNVQGGAIRNEDELNRDWLVWLYAVSRVAVLLSVVYFHSSFSRFVLVIGAVLLVHLHQAGWFPFRVELQNPRAAENNRNHNIQEMERIMDDGLEDDDGDRGDEGINETALQPGFLTCTWSFISTFFTSLVPEAAPRAAR